MPYKELPPKCECGAILRPDVVFFNEPLDTTVIESAFFETARSEIMLVVGTSCVINPAAYLPILAKESGAVLIEINFEPTPITGFANASISGEAGTIMPELVEKLKKKCS